MSFIELEHEIRDLLREHSNICQLIDELDDDPMQFELRQKYIDQAFTLKNLIETLHEKQKKVAAEEEARYLEENNDFEDKEQTPEKLEFLKALYLRPKTSIDEPANRKSKRNRIPATKLIVSYGNETNKSSPKKRLLRRKLIEEPRPSSTPSISSNVPTRFITESMVDCDMCFKPFKTVQVTNAAPTASKNVCFICQAALESQEKIDQIIDQQLLSKPVSLPSSGAATTGPSSSNELLLNPLQNVSRASSPGYTCD